MATQRSRWYAPFIRLLRAAAYLTSHTLVALLLIGAITVVEELSIAWAILSSLAECRSTGFSMRWT